MQSVDVRTGTLVGTPDQEIDEVDLVPVRTYWQLVRQRFLRHRLAVIALVVLAIIDRGLDDRAARDRRRLPALVASRSSTTVPSLQAPAGLQPDRAEPSSCA